MNNVIDLDRERRIQALINNIAAKCNANPALAARTRQMLHGELTMIEQPNPLSIRLPAPLINRLDDLTARINASPRALERRFKRTDTLREALVRGIKIIETELAKGQRP
jgi:hypothetical protein